MFKQYFELDHNFEFVVNCISGWYFLDQVFYKKKSETIILCLLFIISF